MIRSKSLNFILLTLVVAAAVLVVGVTKFYFIPKVDRFLELSIEQEMKANMKAFEQVLHVVTVAAQGDKLVVRRALGMIHSSKDIPVELRRSQAIQKQYGFVAEKDAQTEAEKKVFATGQPLFLKDNNSFTYIYPLAANQVCQDCHHQVDKPDQPIPLDYTMGLVIAKNSPQVLVQSKLFFFVKDLFVANVTLIFVVILLFYLAGVWLFVLPTKEIKSQLTALAEKLEQGQEEENHDPAPNEFQGIQALIHRIRHRLHQ